MKNIYLCVGIIGFCICISPRWAAAKATTSRTVQSSLFWTALRYPDWRVQTLAIYALTGGHSTPSTRAQLAAWLRNEWVALADLEERLLSPRVKAIHTGLRRLIPYAQEPAVARMFDQLYAATQVEDSAVKHRYAPALLRPINIVRQLVTVGRNTTSLSSVMQIGTRIHH